MVHIFSKKNYHLNPTTFFLLLSFSSKISKVFGKEDYDYHPSRRRTKTEKMDGLSSQVHKSQAKIKAPHHFYCQVTNEFFLNFATGTNGVCCISLKNDVSHYNNKYFIIQDYMQSRLLNFE